MTTQNDEYLLFLKEVWESFLANSEMVVNYIDNNNNYFNEKEKILDISLEGISDTDTPNGAMFKKISYKFYETTAKLYFVYLGQNQILTLDVPSSFINNLKDHLTYFWTVVIEDHNEIPQLHYTEQTLREANLRAEKEFNELDQSLSALGYSVEVRYVIHYITSNKAIPINTLYPLDDVRAFSGRQKKYVLDNLNAMGELIRRGNKPTLSIHQMTPEERFECFWEFAYARGNGEFMCPASILGEGVRDIKYSLRENYTNIEDLLTKSFSNKLEENNFSQAFSNLQNALLQDFSTQVSFAVIESERNQRNQERAESLQSFRQEILNKC